MPSTEVYSVSDNQLTLHSNTYQHMIDTKQTITFKQRLNLVLGQKQRQRKAIKWSTVK